MAQNLTLDDFGGANFENCSENLLYTRPDAVLNVHRAFLEVGSDVIETNTFGATQLFCRNSALPTKPTT
jgi:5-methyltetrahydrofolate--homocysteine methyltransferase